jgi:hypothetical protein
MRAVADRGKQFLAFQQKIDAAKVLLAFIIIIIVVVLAPHPPTPY